MSVSPADFELYSRVTGSPLPRSPQEQMRMAPHVYNFIRHNQYAQTKREPSTLQKAAGFLGKAALVGAGLGALYGASDAFGRDPEASTTSVPSTSNTGGEAIDLNYEPEYQSQGDAINISSTPQINISPGYESQYEPQGDLIAVSQNEVPTQQGADIPAASLQGDPEQYVVGSYPLASPQTEYPSDKYFSPRGDYNDPENIRFGLPTNKAGRTQLSKFINTLHAPQINEELIDDNSQLVDHPDQPPGEVPHTPEEAIARSQAWAVSQDLESQGKVKYGHAWHSMIPEEGQVNNPQMLSEESIIGGLSGRAKEKQIGPDPRPSVVGYATQLPRVRYGDIGHSGIHGVTISPAGTDPRLIDVYHESKQPGAIDNVEAWTSEVINPEFAQSFQEDIGDQYGADWSQKDLEGSSIRNLLNIAKREKWTRPIRPRVS